MARAATETQRAGLTGLEFGLAIPGTVGGAVWANAGAHEFDVATVLESARVLDAGGGEALLAAEDLALAYRDSRFKRPRGVTAGDRARGDVRSRVRPMRTRSRRGWTRSATGGRRTSRSASPRRAASSATRTDHRRGG